MLMLFPGAGEFHQRLERFKAPTFQGSRAAAKSPDSPPPRTCVLVSGLQQKLQCSLTPSSQQASRAREVGPAAESSLVFLLCESPDSFEHIFYDSGTETRAKQAAAHL